MLWRCDQWQKKNFNCFNIHINSSLDNCGIRIVYEECELNGACNRNGLKKVIVLYVHLDSGNLVSPNGRLACLSCPALLRRTSLSTNVFFCLNYLLYPGDLAHKRPSLGKIRLPKKIFKQDESCNIIGTRCSLLRHLARRDSRTPHRVNFRHVIEPQASLQSAPLARLNCGIGFVCSICTARKVVFSIGNTKRASFKAKALVYVWSHSRPSKSTVRFATEPRAA